MSIWLYVHKTRNWESSRRGRWWCRNTRSIQPKSKYHCADETIRRWWAGEGASFPLMVMRSRCVCHQRRLGSPRPLVDKKKNTKKTPKQWISKRKFPDIPHREEYAGFPRLPKREIHLHHADPCPCSSPAEMVLRCSTVIRFEDRRMWQPLLLTELIKPEQVLNKTVRNAHKWMRATIRWAGALGQKLCEIKIKAGKWNV